MLHIAGMPLAQRIGWLQKDDPQAALQRIRHGIEEHELCTLLVSRLVPGGRIPVVVAPALGGYPWQCYSQAAVLAAVVGAILLMVVAHLVQRHRRSR